jgi:hypothetical protein
VKRALVASLLTLAALALPIAADAAETLHQVKFQAKGSEFNPSGVVPVRWREREVINHIKGQPPGEPVPKNQILVAWVLCSDVPDLTLWVWNKDVEHFLLVPHPIHIPSRVSVASNKKTPGTPGSRRDSSFSGVSTSEFVARYSGVLQFGYKALPKKFNTPGVCPTKGKSLTLEMTLEAPDQDAVLTGKLKLGKLLDVQ